MSCWHHFYFEGKYCPFPSLSFIIVRWLFSNCWETSQHLPCKFTGNCINLLVTTAITRFVAQHPLCDQFHPAPASKPRQPLATCFGIHIDPSDQRYPGVSDWFLGLCDWCLMPCDIWRDWCSSDWSTNGHVFFLILCIFKLAWIHILQECVAQITSALQLTTH